MNFFTKLVMLFIEKKILFKSPKKYKIVVLDDESKTEFESFLNDYNYIFLESRYENLKKIYLSPKIIFGILKNYNGNIFTSYLITLIKIIDPKIVLTFIDNSFKFYEISQILNKQFKFLAVQNSARWELNFFNEIYKKKLTKYNYLKKINIPYFLVHGKNDVNLYRKFKAKVKKFIIVGSVRLENFFKHFRNKKNRSRKTYDICLISDSIDLSFNKKYFTKNLERDFALYYQYIIKFCIEKKLKFVFAFKRLKNSESFQSEKNFLKNYLPIKYYQYLMKNSVVRTKNNIYKSYEVALNSRLIIATFSTMLGEMLSANRKILSCNFTKNKLFDFPVSGICQIKKVSYEKFRFRLLQLLIMTQKDFNKKIYNKNYYLVNNYKFLPSKILKSTLNQFL